jgi:hypothetical protein
LRLDNQAIVLYGVDALPDADLVRRLVLGRALVYVADRTAVDAEALARRLVDAGGVAEACEVDLLDPQEVEAYTVETAAWSGRLDLAVVGMRNEPEPARLAVARVAAQAMAECGAGTVVVLAADTITPSRFRELVDDAAAKNVEVLTALRD